MVNRFNAIINRYKITTAKYAGGDYNWNVSTINYGTYNGSGPIDNTPSLFVSGIKLHIEPLNDALAQDKFRECEFWGVCGDKDNLGVGNILQLTTGTDFPTFTILQSSEELQYEAFKTPKIGQILDAQQIVYSPVYFDYTVSILPGNPEYKLDPSLDLSIKKAVIFTRPGITEGMLFQDLTVGGAQTIWRIGLVDYRTNLCILHLNLPDRV